MVCAITQPYLTALVQIDSVTVTDSRMVEIAIKAIVLVQTLLR